jgi:hypothetical protein
MAGGSLLAALKQYVGDALPGGSLSPELAPVRKYGEGVAQRAGQLVRDPTEFARQALLDVVPNRAEADAAQARVMGGSLDPQAYARYVGKIQDLGSLLASIKVYHGSPHKFDKFDLSKIGTGEGAQMYGHGAYLAESPRVAKEYADSLSPLEILHNGRAVGVFDKDPAANAAHQIRATGGDVNKAIKRAGNIYNGKWRDDVIAEIKRLGPGDVSERVDGHLYEANLRWPDAAREAADPLGPQHFLDWDKPLSGQPAGVREFFEPRVAPIRAVEAQPAGAEWGDLAAPRHYDPTGRELLQLLGDGEMNLSNVLSGGTGGAQASAALRKAGIPGIRYLDAGSRSAGNGTSNYVVFDDSLIELLKRNGAPIR